MKQKYMLLGAIFLVGNLAGGRTSDQVIKLHKEIGKELIFIRRDVPAMHATVYSLLDKTGSLYRLSTAALKKKKVYKQIAHEERHARLALRDENKKLKVELDSLAQTHKVESTQVSTLSDEVSKLTSEKVALEKRVAELENKEQAYAARIKELEVPTTKSAAAKKSSKEQNLKTALGRKQIRGPFSI